MLEPNRETIATATMKDGHMAIEIEGDEVSAVEAVNSTCNTITNKIMATIMDKIRADNRLSS